VPTPPVILHDGLEPFEIAVNGRIQVEMRYASCSMMLNVSHWTSGAPLAW